MKMGKENIQEKKQGRKKNIPDLLH